jgi:hypothetical protein
MGEGKGRGKEGVVAERKDARSGIDEKKPILQSVGRN